MILVREEVPIRARGELAQPQAQEQTFTFFLTTLSTPSFHAPPAARNRPARAATGVQRGYEIDRARSRRTPSHHVSHNRTNDAAPNTHRRLQFARQSHPFRFLAHPAVSAIRHIRLRVPAFTAKAQEKAWILGPTQDPQRTEAAREETGARQALPQPLRSGQVGSAESR